MPVQDLQITLTGKDISASDAFRKLAAASLNAKIEASRNLDDLGRKINETSKSSSESVTSGFGATLQSWAGSGLMGILGGIAGSVTYGVMNVVSQAGSDIMAGLKSSVIDYNSTLEQAGIGFTTMLGSGKAASDFLTKLQDFGLKTPFQTDQLIQLSQQMMGYGIAAKNVIPDLTALGDAAAASGRTGGDGLNNIVLAFEQMSARGRVDLGDINQLTSGGVPALKILAAAYDTTTGGILKMIGSGKLMAADALPKLTAGIEKGTSKTAALGGMMNKQSSTFEGAMSNISDSLNRALGTAFKPVYSIVEKLAIGIEKFTTSKGFTTWANDAGKVVSKAMSLIGGALKAVFGDPKVQESIGHLGASLGTAFKDVGPAVAKILPNLIQFGKDVMPAIINVITGVVDKIPTLLKWWGQMSSGLAQAGPTIAGVIGFLSDFGGTMFNVANSIKDFVVGAIKNFENFFSDSQKRFNDFIGWIGGVGKNIVDGLVNGITGAWGLVTSTVQGLIDLIPKVVRDALGIHSPSKVFQDIGSYVGQGLTKGLLGSVDQIKSASTQMANAVTSAFKSGTIGKGTELAALATVSKTTARLKTLSAERDKVNASLASLKSARTGVHDDTLAATLSAGNITSFGAPGDAVTGLRALVGKTKTFNTDLQSLMKKGVSGTMLTQLVDGWNSDPDTALSTANGLLSNPTDLKQVLSLQKQLDTAGRALGATAGHGEYDSQINAATGKSKVLTWEMQKAAAAGLKTVSRDLNVTVNLSGTYAGTKESLAKTLTQLLRDEVKKGTIPKNWATG